MAAITGFKQIAYNRTARSGAIKYIVVHDTGNTGKGADAQSHYKYFNGGDRGSSADIFVDDNQALQVNDWNKYYTWHCGDGHSAYGITNGNSIGVEMCINSDGDYAKAFSRMVEVVKYLMNTLGIDAEHVVRHYDASRKNCPASMSGNAWAKWKEFKQRITEDIDMEELKKLEERVKKLETPMIYNYIDKNMPDWARPTVQKLVDKGFLKGDGGGLGLTDDLLRLLVINDRAGIYG